MSFDPEAIQNIINPNPGQWDPSTWGTWDKDAKAGSESEQAISNAIEQLNLNRRCAVGATWQAI